MLDRAMFPFFSTKFLMALLPLVILGYILGWMLSAASSGLTINPVLATLDGVGILLALWHCAEAA